MSHSEATIWRTLSKINVNDFTESKAGLTYLSWSHAYRMMMENYPELTIKWLGTTDKNGVTRDVTYYEGGTASVSCAVTIGSVVREMWLPVMDSRMKSIENPSSRDISDAKMRCLVKCFALLGLGIYVYSGDGLPYEEEVAPKAKPSSPAAGNIVSWERGGKAALVPDDPGALGDAVALLSGLIDACRDHGGVDTKTLSAASAVLEARGPLDRLKKAIAHLDREISRV